MYTFPSVRSIDFPRSYPPRLRVTRAGAWRDPGVRFFYVRTRGSLEEGHERQERKGETRGYAHDAETTRRIVARRVCIMPDTDARSRASFPVFGSHVAAALSAVTRCDTCRTNSEIFATPCTRRYPRGRVAESAGNAPHA